MNREEKAAVIDRVATELQEADAIFAVDPRGISVKQSGELRDRLVEANTNFRVVKNRLTKIAADRAGDGNLSSMLEGPTALAFVRGDAAAAAKALAAFRREHNLLEFKGGVMNGAPLTAEEVESIARLPAREVLYGQLVGVVASPLTGLARGLGAMLGGLAIALGQIQERGLVGQDSPAGGAGAGDGDDAPAEAAPAAEAEPAADPSEAPDSGAAAAAPDEQGSPPADAAGEDAEVAPSEAPGDPVAEAEAAEQETTDQPSEG